MELTVGIIGVGNMGEALLSGLLKSGTPTSNISFAQRDDERAGFISSKYGIVRESLLTTAASDVVLLCVKPKDIAQLCEQIKGSLKKGAVVVSVAAGKTIAGIQSIVGDDVAVVLVLVPGLLVRRGRDVDGLPADDGRPPRGRATGCFHRPGGRPGPAGQHRGGHRHERPGRSGRQP